MTYKLNKFGMLARPDQDDYKFQIGDKVNVLDFKGGDNATIIDLRTHLAFGAPYVVMLKDGCTVLKFMYCDLELVKQTVQMYRGHVIIDIGGQNGRSN